LRTQASAYWAAVIESLKAGSSERTTLRKDSREAWKTSSPTRGLALVNSARRKATAQGAVESNFQAADDLNCCV